MDFSILEDIVIGRNLVDTYIMSIVQSLHHSLVDVTYSGKNSVYGV